MTVMALPAADETLVFSLILFAVTEPSTSTVSEAVTPVTAAPSRVVSLPDVALRSEESVPMFVSAVLILLDRLVRPDSAVSILPDSAVRPAVASSETLAHLASIADWTPESFRPLAPTVRKLSFVPSSLIEIDDDLPVVVVMSFSPTAMPFPAAYSWTIPLTGMLTLFDAGLLPDTLSSKVSSSISDDGTYAASFRNWSLGMLMMLSGTGAASWPFLVSYSW